MAWVYLLRGSSGPILHWIDYGSSYCHIRSPYG